MGWAGAAYCTAASVPGVPRRHVVGAGETAAVWGLPRRCPAVAVPAVRSPAATPGARGAATARRRARLLMSGAAAAAVATAVLLALLAAALVAGWGGGPVVSYGSAAFGAAGLAVG